MSHSCSLLHPGPWCRARGPQAPAAERRGRRVQGAPQGPGGGEGGRRGGGGGVRGLRAGRARRWPDRSSDVVPLPPPDDPHVGLYPRPPGQGQGQVLASGLHHEHRLDRRLLVLHGLVGHAHRPGARHQVLPGSP